MENSPEMCAVYDDLVSKLQHKDMDLNPFLSDPSKVVVVGIGGPPGPARVGVWLFFNMVEDLLYDPTVPAKNNQFEFVVQLWQDILWSIGVFPAAHRRHLDRIAFRCGLRLANGVPQVFSPFPGLANVNGISGSRRVLHPSAKLMYPLPSPSMFTLENHEDIKPLTRKEEEDRLALLHERSTEHSRTRWWPDTVGET